MGWRHFAHFCSWMQIAWLPICRRQIYSDSHHRARRLTGPFLTRDRGTPGNQTLFAANFFPPRTARNPKATHGFKLQLRHERHHLHLNIFSESEKRMSGYRTCRRRRVSNVVFTNRDFTVQQCQSCHFGYFPEHFHLIDLETNFGKVNDSI